jgi:hypothetical protein
MVYVQGYARNGLPCGHNTRISAVSIVEEEIVSGYEFCGNLFDFRRGESSRSRIDHCLFGATQIAFKFLDDEIRGLE